MIIQTKKVLWFFLALLVLGLGSLIFSHTKNNNAEEKTERHTLFDARYQGGVKCVQKVTMNGLGSMENTIYFDTQKNLLRFDSHSSYQNMPDRETHMIDDGKKAYLWGSGMQFHGIQTGMIMESQASREDAPIDIDDLVKNHYQAPGVDCQEWKIDERVFQKPKDIQFKDMNHLMGGENKQIDTQKTTKRLPVSMGNMNCDQVCGAIPDAGTKEACYQGCKKGNQEK